MRSLLKKYWVLIIILCLATFLRLFNLQHLPVGLHGDEASIGYNAYSLLKTAHDQNGNFLPLAVDQFGDFRPAGYFYLDIPFVATLGLSAEATRLPGALFGIGCVILLYFFILELFNKKTLALLGAIVLAISPWHIDISRATSEGVVAMFFVILGCFLFLKAIKGTTRVGLMLGSFASLIISLFFYHSARVFLPLFFLPFSLLCLRIYKKSQKTIIVTGAVYVGLFIALIFFLTAGHGLGRAAQVSIFNIPGGDTQLRQQLGEEGTMNPLITRFLHNKFYFYGNLFLYSYSQYFTGDFFFIDNGLPIRYKIPWNGSLNIIELPFLLLGFSFLLTEALKNKKWIFLIPILWLIIAPIPGGLTYEDIPDVQRASLMIPAFSIIIAYGIYETFALLRNKKIQIFCGVVVALFYLQNFILFFNNYFYHSFLQEPWFRSAGESDLIYTLDNLDKGEKNPIVMTTQNNNNFIFYLFYNRIDPYYFQQQGSPREKDGLRFQNITYMYTPCPLLANAKPSDFSQHTIFVNDWKCSIPQSAQTLDTIRTPDGLPVFTIISF